ncbi:hypothetical protein LWI29_011040 [Acer saccharum]|uniref:Uncharacterized protein n=1 Tax=Acer saccharum TaxID=4024 RepID=A0AA39W8V0_ACESA|nr:hypothetical protein LWI29_011040 [Acer saccharum]
MAKLSNLKLDALKVSGDNYMSWPPFPPASLSRELPFPIKFQPVKPAAAFQLPSSSSRRVRAVEFQPPRSSRRRVELQRRPSFVVRRPASSSVVQLPASSRRRVSFQRRLRRRPASVVQLRCRRVSFQHHLIWSSSIVPAGWVFISGGSSTTTTTPSWVFNISPFSNLTFAIHPSFGFH